MEWQDFLNEWQIVFHVVSQLFHIVLCASILSGNALLKPRRKPEVSRNQKKKIREVLKKTRRDIISRVTHVEVARLKDGKVLFYLTLLKIYKKVLMSALISSLK